jgi:hypothetical protein
VIGPAGRRTLRHAKGQSQQARPGAAKTLDGAPSPSRPAMEIPRPGVNRGAQPGRSRAAGTTELAYDDARPLSNAANSRR